MTNRVDKARPESDQDQTAIDTQWSSLQLLRHQLQSMDTPLSGAMRLVFTQEKILQQLASKPRSMNLPGLDQSQTLQQAVDAAAFSEQALLETVESPMRLHSASLRDADTLNQSTQHQKKDERPKEERLLDQEANENPAIPMQLDPTKQQPDQPDAALPAEALLTPEYMPQWIDEILKIDEEEASNQIKTSQINSWERNTQAAGNSTSKNKYKSENKLTQQNVTNSSSRRKRSKVSYLPGDKIKPRDVLAGPEAEQEHPTTAASGKDVKQYKTQIDSLRNSVFQPPDLLQGIALLEQLVQIENTKLADSPKSQPASPSQLRPNSAVEHRNLLANNNAWQQLQQSLDPAYSATPEQRENLNLTTSLAITDKKKASYQDDSERIAELVNEALVEQALRNGIDLS